MVRIANRSQQVYTGGIYPISAYSRIVSLDIEVSEGGGTGYAYTNMLGNNLWLLEVKCWVREKPANIAQWTEVFLVTGQIKPQTLADIQTWENLLPKYQAETPETPWCFYDGNSFKNWEMSKRFMGQSRRFGIYAERSGIPEDVVNVSFRIAEG